MKNSLVDDVCGVNGHVSIVEEFGTSSYDKDGSINVSLSGLSHHLSNIVLLHYFMLYFHLSHY